MKKRRTLKLLIKIKCIIIIFLLITVNVTIAQTENMAINVDYEKKEIVITGNSSTLRENREITLTVLQLNKTAQNYGKEPFMQVFHLIDQTRTDAAGRFKFSFWLMDNADKGLYRVRIAEKGNTQLYEGFFAFLTQNHIVNILSVANSANSAQEMKDLLDSVGTLINLDYTLHDSLLLNKDKMPVYKSMLRDENSVEELKNFTKIDELPKVFTMYSILAAINQEASLNEIGKYLSDYKDILLFNGGGVYKTYTEILGDEGRREVWQDISTASIERLDNLHDVISNRTVLYAIQHVKGWNEIKNILEINKDVLNINLTDYEGLDPTITRPEVDKKLVNQSFNSLYELKVAFENAVRQAKEINSNNVSPKGGGGGHLVRISDSSPAPTNTTTPTPNINFTDIENLPWSIESIQALNAKGIIQGKTESLFFPNDLVTREEFIKMLILGFGLLDNNSDSSFVDVNKDAWYYQYIASAESLEITKGNGHSDFGVGKSITRQDMAVLAHRAAIKANITFTETGSKAIFDDESEIAPYAVASVKQMQASGILNGVGEDKFAPLDYSTRAQAAKIIYGLVQLMGER